MHGHSADRNSHENNTVGLTSRPQHHKTIPQSSEDPLPRLEPASKNSYVIKNVGNEKVLSHLYGGHSRPDGKIAGRLLTPGRTVLERKVWASSWANSWASSSGPVTGTGSGTVTGTGAVERATKAGISKATSAAANRSSATPAAANRTSSAATAAANRTSKAKKHYLVVQPSVRFSMPQQSETFVMLVAP